MEPMLHPGDIVVIDRDDKIIVKNKMFAIYHEGGLTAKFLENENQLAHPAADQSQCRNTDHRFER